MRQTSTPSIDGAALRGLAILGIFLHNYAHLLSGIVKENEYSFVQSRPLQLLQELAHPTAYLPLHLISFFGHYGVPLFLFLSAYGLEKKYAGREEPVPAGHFVRGHYAKLWVMMIIGYLPQLLWDLCCGGTSPHTWANILPQLGLVNVLMPFGEGMVWPGPYWYFGLMVQIYVVYRLFLFRRSWKWAVGLLLLCQLAQHLSFFTVTGLMWLRYNFVGSMLPFVLGLLYARYGGVVSQGRAMLLLLLSLVGIFVGSFFYATWLWVPALVCVAGVSLLQLLPQLVARPLAWLGGISSAIFVFHPLVRLLTFYRWEEKPYLGWLAYAVLTILVAWLLQPVLHSATRWVSKRLG